MIFVLLSFCAKTAFAEIHWDSRRQEFQATPDESQVEAAFKFRNAGDKPISIRRIYSSCGCTSATSSKETYAPGEEGVVNSKFVFGNRVGPQRKIISVTTSDGAVHDLELSGWINEPLTIIPSLLYWRVGESKDEKKAQFKIPDTFKLKIRDVVSSNEKIIARLSDPKPGEPLFVSVVPTTTDQPESAEITVSTEDAQGKVRPYKLHVRIK